MISGDVCGGLELVHTVVKRAWYHHNCSLERLGCPSAGWLRGVNKLFTARNVIYERMLSTVLTTSTRGVVIGIENRTQNVDKQP